MLEIQKTKAAAPGQESAALAKQQADSKAIRSRSTGTEAQFSRLIALLRTGPQTTYSLRKHGIAQTSSRIWDLRARGYIINTELVNAYDTDGYLHTRVALYSLVQEPLQPAGETLAEIPRGGNE